MSSQWAKSHGSGGAMTAVLARRIRIEALFGFASRVTRVRVKFSHMIGKGLLVPSSIKLSVFKKVGIFVLLSLIVIPSKTYAQKINTEKFFDSKLGREVEVVEGEIIVRFKRRLEAGSIRKMNEAFGNKIKKKIKNINVHRIKLGRGKKIENMLKIYRKDPNVIFAEPNYIAKALVTTPNDLSFSQQWGLTKIYAPEAWDIEKGNSNVIIAIVDTGIDLDHPDLDEKIVPGYDFVNEDSEPMDDNGHGTHCAGIAAAESNNGQGIAGVAWGSKLMPVKVLDSDGAGTYSDVAEGIIYTADNGAKVINLSLGAYSYSQTLQDAVDYAYQKGCVIVAAAGNDNTNEPLYPAAYNNVTSVAATDQSDERWTSSNYGDYIDVCAPGVDIYSTSLDNIYTSASGTSASSSFVSGLAALLLSQDSTWANYEVENKIRQSADDLGSSGRDDYYGYGRISLVEALKQGMSLIHDVSIVDFLVSPRIFNIGQSVKIIASVVNQGSYTESNVIISVYINNSKIGESSLPLIAPGEKKDLEFSWVPSIPQDESVVVIKCEINPVEGEIDIQDNIKIKRFEYTKDLTKGVVILHSTTVHTYIVRQAFNLWPNDTSNEIYSYLPWIRLGAGWYEEWGSNEDYYSEDGGHDYFKDMYGDAGLYSAPIPTTEHFCDPDQSLYYIRGTFWAIGARRNAFIRAKYIWDNYVISNYPSSKSRAYYYFGRVVHLLGDLSLPAHTFWDDHSPAGGDDSYEDYIAGTRHYDGNPHYQNWNSSDASGYQKPSSPGNYLYNLFYHLAQRTQSFPSDDYDGNYVDEYGSTHSEWDLNIWNYEKGDVEDGWGIPNDNTCYNIGSKLMPKAMEYVAGLFNHFAYTVDSTNPLTPTNVTDGVDGWSNDDTPTFSWTACTDNLSKVKGYYWSTTNSTPDSNDNWTTNTWVTLPRQPNGSHTFYVAAMDNAGNIGSAGNHDFYIDVAVPTVYDYQSGDPTWRNASGAKYNVDFYDYHSKLSYAQYKICSGTNQSGAVLKNWTNIAININSSWYADNWEIDFSACQQGTNYVSVRAYDNAGNVKTTNDVFYVRKDTVDPIAGTYGWSFSNYQWFAGNWVDNAFDSNPSDASPSSGLDKEAYRIWHSVSGGHWETSYKYILISADNVDVDISACESSSDYYELRVYVWDVAGNSDYEYRRFKVDRSVPSQVSSPHWDDGSYSVDTTIVADWSDASDSQSEIVDYYLQVDEDSTDFSSGLIYDGWIGSSGSNKTLNSSNGVKNGHAYYFRVKVKNGSGLESNSWSSTSAGVTVDTEDPTVTELEIAYYSGSTYFDGNYAWYDQGSDPAFGFTSNPQDANLDHVDFTWDNSGGTGYSGGDYDDNCEEPGLDGDVSDVSGPNYSLEDDPDGTIALTVTAYDKVNRSGTQQIKIKFDNTPPISSVSSLSQYQTILSFIVQWSGDDGSGCGLQSYDVQYKDGTGSWSDLLTNTTSTSETFSPTSPVPVQDGHTYYFRVRVKDNVGNQEDYPVTADTFTTVDISPPPAPTISSLTHAEDIWSENTNPSLSWTEPSDVSGIGEYCIAFDLAQNYTPDPEIDARLTAKTTSYINISDGRWYFHCRARDGAGHWGDTDTYGPVKIDTVYPTFPRITSSKDPAKEGDVTITVVASEQMSEITVTVTQNGGSPTNVSMTSSDDITWSGIYPIVSGYDGTAVINVSGKDLAGKTGTGAGSFTVDTTPPMKPEISSSHPEDYPFSSSNPSFDWTSSTDSLSGLAGYSYALNQIENYDLDTTTETTGTSASFTKPDGTWWFHLRTVDNAGNGSEIDQYKFIIDTTSPTFTASSSKDPAKEGDVTITAQANEKLKQAPTVTVKQNGQGSAATVTMNSSDSITWTGTYTVVTGYDGTAIINVVSGVDMADNTGTGSGSFEVDTIAPTVSISISPTPPLKTGEFQITLIIADASNIPQKPSLGYTPSGSSLISVSLTGSDKNWTGSSYIESTTPEGTAKFSFSAIDAAGNRGTTITEGETFEIDTTIVVSIGGTSSNSDGTIVEVPKNAVSENINIRITVPDPDLSIIKEADNNIIDDKGINPIKTVNLYRDIIAIGDISGDEIKNFAKPIIISIPYPDDDQNGVVDSTNIKEQTLRMFHLDENLKKWVLVPNSQVDSTGNNLNAEVNHFSIYTIMQLSPPSNLSEVFGYPNPCYVKKDGYVRISNIPLDAKHVKIYIYNVAGELVRILEEGDEIETQAGSKLGRWDGRNENNEMVASGIYIYLIKSEGSKKIEKIAIFW